MVNWVTKLKVLIKISVPTVKDSQTRTLVKTSSATFTFNGTSYVSSVVTTWHPCLWDRSRRLLEVYDGPDSPALHVSEPE